MCNWRGGVVSNSTTTPENSSEVHGVRVRLTRKSRPGVGAQVTGHGGPDPEHPTPRRWKRLRPPSSEGVGRVRWASLAIFFLDSGLGDFLHLGTPGTCRRFFSGWSVQPMGLVRWHQPV